MSERFLKWAIRRHFREKGFKVRIARIKLGNTEIDGEVEGKGWKIALELKTPGDDLTRGLGQVAEALAFGYETAAIVTTLKRAKRANPALFDRLGLVLLGVDSKGEVHSGPRAGQLTIVHDSTARITSPGELSATGLRTVEEQTRISRAVGVEHSLPTRLRTRDNQVEDTCK